MSKASDPSAKSFLHSALEALRAERITEEVAYSAVNNEAELRRALRGVL